MPAGEPGSGQDLGMGETALPYLNPLATGVDVHLAAFEGVRVHAGFGPIRHVRYECVDQQAGHVVHVAVPERLPGDTPEVELVRGTGVEAVDGVAPEHDAGTHEEDIVDGFGGQGSQGRRDHGACVATQHLALIDVAGMASVLLAASGVKARLS